MKGSQETPTDVELDKVAAGLYIFWPYDYIAKSVSKSPRPLSVEVGAQDPYSILSLWVTPSRRAVVERDRRRDMESSRGSHTA